MAQERCNCCDRPLTGKQTVWPVYDNTADSYYADHDDIPEGHDDLGGTPSEKLAPRKRLEKEQQHEQRILIFQ